MAKSESFGGPPKVEKVIIREKKLEEAVYQVPKHRFSNVSSNEFGLDRAELVVSGGGDQEVYQNPAVPKLHLARDEGFYQSPRSSVVIVKGEEVYDHAPPPKPVLAKSPPELKTPKLLLQALQSKPRNKMTLAGIYDNPAELRGSQDSGLHYKVQNEESGLSDVYARPKTAPKRPKPPRAINHKNLTLKFPLVSPPKLPPRNSQFSSPRSSSNFDNVQKPMHNNHNDR